MEKIYRKILGNLIKNERIDKGYNLSKASKLCDVSVSTFSRIENNLSVSDEVYFHVAKSLMIPCNLTLYDNLFETLYFNICYGYIDDEVINNWNAILDIKDEILKSPYIYRYYLYEFVYFLYIKQSSLLITNEVFNNYLNLSNFLCEYDKSIYYDYLGVYYFLKSDYESMRINFSEAFKYKMFKLPYAMALSHAVNDDTYNGKFIDAIDKFRISNEIFKEYGLNNRIFAGLLDIGNIYSLMGDTNKALFYFLQSFNTDLKEIKVASLNNILLCYILNDDEENFYKWLSIADEFDVKYLASNFYQKILHYLYSKNNFDLFDYWFEKSKSCKLRDSLQDDIINFLYLCRNSMDCLNYGENIIDRIVLPHNKSEYVYICKILMKKYHDNGDLTKEKEIFNKLQLVAMNKNLINVYNSL